MIVMITPTATPTKAATWAVKTKHNQYVQSAVIKATCCRFKHHTGSDTSVAKQKGT